MTFGEDWGWGASKDESKKIFDAFAQAGGNFIDSANHYTIGTSEKFVGEFIASDREHFVLATKYSLNARPTDPNGGGNHRKSTVQALDASLKRLQTDYIDLYWVHAPDDLTPVDEMMRALDDMVRSGKVLYVGVSDFAAWVIAQANTLTDLKGWSPFVALQTQYSLIERTSERELLPMAENLDLAVTAWGPLGAGVLTGKYKSKSGPKGTRLGDTEWGAATLTDHNLKIAETVKSIAQQIGRTSSQVALNWVRQQKRGVIIPIFGARTLAQAQDNLGALDFTLTDEQLSKLDEVSKIELGFPHDFIAHGRHFVFGQTYSLIDNHRQRVAATR
jgi:aryl-alcohol dehydrogenase-like predicted oxidoreductase